MNTQNQIEAIAHEYNITLSAAALGSDRNALEVIAASQEITLNGAALGDDDNAVEYLQAALSGDSGNGGGEGGNGGGDNGGGEPPAPAPSLTLQNFGGGAVAGRTKVFDNAIGTGYSLTPVVGKKALAASFDFATPVDLSAEFALMLRSMDDQNHVAVGVNGLGPFVRAQVNGVYHGNQLAAIPHTSGNKYALWRDSLTGAWGVVLPNGTNTGDLSAMGAPTGELIPVLFASANTGGGAMTVLNTGGPALPVGYTYQTFTG